MASTARHRIIWSALTAILAVLIIAVVARYLGKGNGGRVSLSGSATSDRMPGEKGTRYHCPMHPTMVADHPGDCPVCQMRMVPMEEEAAGGPAPETTPPAPPPRKKVIYRSTMNPGEVSDRPGKDSMGMEMEPVDVEESIFEASKVEGLAAVRIPTRKQQLIGVKTSIVRRTPMVRTIRTVGRVTVDETRIRHVHTKVGGWVERLTVNATGERVRKGQPLLRIYSPELLATQEEYLLALKARRSLAEGSLPEAARGAEDLVESSRRRLLLYDFTRAQIEELEATGTPSRTVTLSAPISGYVLQRNVTQGEKIGPDTNLLDIADLSRVWVLASVYEYELPFVRVGQPATMTLAYLPGKIYRGKLDIVYPVLEAATRTVQVRLVFSNPELDLKPEMFATVELQSDLGERLTIPESALISTGTRSVAFVAQGDGYFEPREVRLGVRLPDAVEVLEGLREGESVVTSGNFLVDSESKLKAALEAAAAPGPAPQGEGAGKPPQEP